MTLKEAYEIQRKEVWALRRENAKLKAGTSSDTELLEKELKSIRYRNQCLEKESERYHRLWRESQKEIQRLRRLLYEIDELKQDKINMQTQYDALAAQLQEALDTISKLKAQMNRDHENSSIPSSQKPFHKKIKNSREKTERKPGGQPGHSGHKRPKLEPTVPVIELEPDPSIINNPDYYPTGKYITKQVVDIEIKVSVCEYRAQIYRSRSNGSRYHAAFPKEAVNELNYGPKIKSLAFLLNNYCNVSIDKTSELIRGITDDRIILSKGLISSLPHTFSSATESERQKIYQMLLLAPSMHSDATPGRVNGKNVQVILCANQYEMLYFFREHKGHEGLKGTPVEEYRQILIHDHDKTYYSYGADHQECLSHVLRYLQDSIDNEPELTWNKTMKEFLSGVIHEVKPDRNISPERIHEIETGYRSILATAEKEYQLHPPNKYYKEGINLYKRMKEYQKNHLLFLSHPEIEYTNNLAERALRRFKRKLRQAVTFRCNESVNALCNCMGIIETGRLQGRNIYALSQEAFSN